MGQTALGPGYAREYETVYILRPSIDKDAADAVSQRVADAIKGQDGTLTGVELWGSRRLSYNIQRHHRGIYVYLKYLGRGATVSEIERQLRLADNVIRYQTIQVRDNVKLEGDVAGTDFSLDFDVPFEPDEPEVPRLRELGLDSPPPERRGRRDDRDRDADSGDAKADAKGDDAKADDAKADAKADDAKEGADKETAGKDDTAKDDTAKGSEEEEN